mgnify:CR=1 FL=1
MSFPRAAPAPHQPRWPSALGPSPLETTRSNISGGYDGSDHTAHTTATSSSSSADARGGAHNYSSNHISRGRFGAGVVTVVAASSASGLHNHDDTDSGGNAASASSASREPALWAEASSGTVRPVSSYLPSLPVTAAGRATLRTLLSLALAHAAAPNDTTAAHTVSRASPQSQSQSQSLSPFTVPLSRPADPAASVTVGALWPLDARPALTAAAVRPAIVSAHRGYIAALAVTGAELTVLSAHDKSLITTSSADNKCSGRAAEPECGDIQTDAESHAANTDDASETAAAAAAAADDAVTVVVTIAAAPIAASSDATGASASAATPAFAPVIARVVHRSAVDSVVDSAGDTNDSDGPYSVGGGCAHQSLSELRQLQVSFAAALATALAATTAHGHSVVLTVTLAAPMHLTLPQDCAQSLGDGDHCSQSLPGFVAVAAATAAAALAAAAATAVSALRHTSDREQASDDDGAKLRARLLLTAASAVTITSAVTAAANTAHAQTGGLLGPWLDTVEVERDDTPRGFNVRPPRTGVSTQSPRYSSVLTVVSESVGSTVSGSASRQRLGDGVWRLQELLRPLLGLPAPAVTAAAVAAGGATAALRSAVTQKDDDGNNLAADNDDDGDNAYDVDIDDDEAAHDNVLFAATAGAGAASAVAVADLAAVARASRQFLPSFLAAAAVTLQQQQHQRTGSGCGLTAPLLVPCAAYPSLALSLMPTVGPSLVFAGLTGGELTSASPPMPTVTTALDAASALVTRLSVAVTAKALAQHPLPDDEQHKHSQAGRLTLQQQQQLLLGGVRMSASGACLKLTCLPATLAAFLVSLQQLDPPPAHGNCATAVYVPVSAPLWPLLDSPLALAVATSVHAPPLAAAVPASALALSSRHGLSTPLDDAVLVDVPLSPAAVLASLRRLALLVAPPLAPGRIGVAVADGLTVCTDADGAANCNKKRDGAATGGASVVTAHSSGESEELWGEGVVSGAPYSLPFITAKLLEQQQLPKPVQQWHEVKTTASAQSSDSQLQASSQPQPKLVGSSEELGITVYEGYHDVNDEHDSETSGAIARHRASRQQQQQSLAVVNVAHSLFRSTAAHGYSAAHGHLGAHGHSDSAAHSQSLAAAAHSGPEPQGPWQWALPRHLAALLAAAAEADATSASAALALAFASQLQSQSPAGSQTGQSGGAAGGAKPFGQDFFLARPKAAANTLAVTDASAGPISANASAVMTDFADSANASGEGFSAVSFANPKSVDFSDLGALLRMGAAAAAASAAAPSSSSSSLPTVNNSADPAAHNNNISVKGITHGNHESFHSCFDSGLETARSLTPAAAALSASARALLPLIGDLPLAQSLTALAALSAYRPASDSGSTVGNGGAGPVGSAFVAAAGGAGPRALRVRPAVVAACRAAEAAVEAVTGQQQ